MFVDVCGSGTVNCKADEELVVDDGVERPLFRWDSAAAVVVGVDAADDDAVVVVVAAAAATAAATCSSEMSAVWALLDAPFDLFLNFFSFTQIKK